MTTEAEDAYIRSHVENCCEGCEVTYYPEGEAWTPAEDCPVHGVNAEEWWRDLNRRLEPNIWQLLEKDAPAGCAAIQDLYSWSLNYSAGEGPFTLLLDLIGWSEENIGEPLYSLKDASLGYVELDKLGLALREYAESPENVRKYIEMLMAAETES